MRNFDKIFFISTIAFMDLELTKLLVAELSDEKREAVTEQNDGTAVDGVSRYGRARYKATLEESHDSSLLGGTQRTRKNGGFGFVFGRGRKPLKDPTSVSLQGPAQQ